MLALSALVLLAACFGGEEASTPPDGAIVSRAGQDCPTCVIESVQVTGGYTSIPYVGDLWTTTWAANDKLYSIFGDGTGMNACFPTLILGEPDEFDKAYDEVSPGCFLPKNPNNEYCEVFGGCSQCLPQCQYTAAGMVELTGPVPNFATCMGADQCIVSRHIPYGTPDVFVHSDKPSSLVAIHGRLYAHMHYPPGEPTSGYLAYSDNNGRSWKQIPDSPWVEKNPFQVTMFINMGQDYGLNRDGYLYGLGIQNEIADPPQSQAVYLLRVPITSTSKVDPAQDPILDYQNYRYFAGLEPGGAVRWSRYQTETVPLEGLTTMAQGAVIYHPGINRFLFLSGLIQADGTGGLFEAPDPWGPWHLAGTFPAGYIPNIIAKDMGPNDFYFTAAGGGGVTYNLNVAHMEMKLRSPGSIYLPLILAFSRKVEQIIDDLDFETRGLTRQRTESRFNVGVPPS
jgi:hypothetical protein